MKCDYCNRKVPTQELYDRCGNPKAVTNICKDCHKRFISIQVDSKGRLYDPMAYCDDCVLAEDM